MRSRSGMLVAPERRMSSPLITKAAAAVRERLCSLFETDVTLTFIRSSMSSLLRSIGAGSWAAPADRYKASAQLRWATWRQRVEVAVLSVTLYLSADHAGLITAHSVPWANPGQTANFRQTAPEIGVSPGFAVTLVSSVYIETGGPMADELNRRDFLKAAAIAAGPAVMAGQGAHEKGNIKSG